MPWMRAGRPGRRTRYALSAVPMVLWAALSVLLGASPAAAKAIDRTIPPLAAVPPVDHKPTNILFETLVGIGILVAVGVIVFLLTRGRGRGGPGPGSGGGGGGGGNGFPPPPEPPPGGRGVESTAPEKAPAYHGSNPG